MEEGSSRKMSKASRKKHLDDADRSNGAVGCGGSKKRRSFSSNVRRLRFMKSSDNCIRSDVSQPQMEEELLRLSESATRQCGSAVERQTNTGGGGEARSSSADSCCGSSPVSSSAASNNDTEKESRGRTKKTSQRTSHSLETRDTSADFQTEEVTRQSERAPQTAEDGTADAVGKTSESSPFFWVLEGWENAQAVYELQHRSRRREGVSLARPKSGNKKLLNRRFERPGLGDGKKETDESTQEGLGEDNDRCLQGVSTSPTSSSSRNTPGGVTAGQVSISPVALIVGKESVFRFPSSSQPETSKQRFSKTDPPEEAPATTCCLIRQSSSQNSQGRSFHNIADSTCTAESLRCFLPVYGDDQTTDPGDIEGFYGLYNARRSYKGFNTAVESLMQFVNRRIANRRKSRHGRDGTSQQGEDQKENEHTSWTTCTSVDPSSPPSALSSSSSSLRSSSVLPSEPDSLSAEQMPGKRGEAHHASPTTTQHSGAKMECNTGRQRRGWQKEFSLHRLEKQPPEEGSLHTQKNKSDNKKFQRNSRGSASRETKDESREEGEVQSDYENAG